MSPLEYREGAAGDIEDRHTAEERRKLLGIHRRRRHNQPASADSAAYCSTVRQPVLQLKPSHSQRPQQGRSEPCTVTKRSRTVY